MLVALVERKGLLPGHERRTRAMEPVRPHDPVWLCRRLDDLEGAYRRLKRAMTAGLLGVAALGVRPSIGARDGRGSG
jgi:hypothetical protein